MRFVRRKILQLLIVLLCVTFLSFLLLELLPGDTATRLCAGAGGQECVDQKRAEFRLDDPMPVRYVRWLGDAVTGDLGSSARNAQPVSEALAERMPVTIELLLYSQFLALLVAVPLAFAAAKRAGGVLDRSSSATLFMLLAVPNFVMAMLLIWIFPVTLGIGNATGYTPFSDGPIASLASLTIPAICLAVAEMAIYMRLLRTDLIATMQEDFIAMARAKGMSPRRVLYGHAFKPSTFSIITVIGLNFGRLIGGTVIIEVIFGLNGLGGYTYAAIQGQDYVPVQGAIVVIACAYVLINFLVDLLYAALDPRIRHARALA
jgi:peptide/nickel transport system permease protein